jgi:hypothetical protein
LDPEPTTHPTAYEFFQKDMILAFLRGGARAGEQAGPETHRETWLETKPTLAMSFDDTPNNKGKVSKIRLKN